MPLWKNDPDLFINNIGPHKYQMEANSDVIETTSLPTKTPDSDWSTIDNQGHFHTFADDDSLPTLEMHSEELIDFLNGGITRPYTYYLCRLCRDVIAPHFMESSGSIWRTFESVPGTARITLTVEHFGQNVEIGETVSWYNKTHFGTGKVMSIHLKTGVELLIACDYMAKRKNVDL